MRRLRYRNTASGATTEYRPSEGDTFGVFVFAGYEPATDLVRELAECDAQGYVVTDANRKTSCPGLYAAGDVCIKPLRQVVTAVGDGALAATELERYQVMSVPCLVLNEGEKVSFGKKNIRQIVVSALLIWRCVAVCFVMAGFASKCTENCLGLLPHNFLFLQEI